MVSRKTPRKRAASLGTLRKTGGYRGLDALEPRILLATHTWTGAVDANWSNAGNWAENAAPAPGEPNVVLVFGPGAANLSNNNDFDASVTPLAVQTIQLTAPGYALSGQVITLTGGITTTAAGGVNVVNLNIIASADLTLAIGDNTTSNTIYLNGIISGAGGLTKNGSGNVYLTAPNNYNGTTIINRGYVLAANDSALGIATGDVATGTVVNAGGSLSLYGNGRHIGDEHLTLNGIGQDGTGALNTANVTVYDGTVLVASSSRINIVAPGSITLNGHLDGSANLTKVGSSTLVLAGGGMYSGTLTVQSDLRVISDLSLATFQVSSLSLGTLAGTGPVAQIGSIGGTIAPGVAGPGKLAVTGGITLDSDTLVQLDLQGTTAGTQHDQFDVAGTVDLGGAGLLVTLGGAFTPTLGDVFVIVRNDSNDAVIGTFGGLAEASLISVSGQTFRLSYVGGDGNDVTLTRANTAIAATTTTVATSTNPSVVGQPVVLTATVSESVAGAPTGIVTFKNGAATIGTANVQINGTAQLTVSNLPGGANSITAVYSGDSSFATSTSSAVIQDVIPAGLTLTLTASQNLIGIGKKVTLNVTAAALAPSQLSPGGLTLEVLDGATVVTTVTLDSSGAATRQVTLSSAGVHPLSVRYAGNLNGFSTTLSSTVNVAAQNLKLFATGGGEGGSPTVVVRDETGAVRFTFDAYAANFTGGVRVAIGDVNGDGVPDIATVPASGGASHVRVFSGVDAALLTQYYAYDPVYAGGFFVAVGDVNADTIGDVIVSPGAGIGPVVQVFSGVTNNLLMSFLAYAPDMSAGISVAAGDVNNDGRADIITAPGFGGAPHVRVFSGGSGVIVQQYYAYASDFPGGVYVAAGDVDGDGHADIITGTQGLGAPHVRVFSGLDGSILTQFYAYDPSFPGGVRVAAGDVDGDGKADIVTSAGPGGAPHIRVFKGTDLTILNQFYAYTLPYTYGAYVA